MEVVMLGERGSHDFLLRGSSCSTTRASEHRGAPRRLWPRSWQRTCKAAMLTAGRAFGA